MGNNGEIDLYGAAGNVLLDAAGNVMLCGVCCRCAPQGCFLCEAPTPKYFDVTVAGVEVKSHGSQCVYFYYVGAGAMVVNTFYFPLEINGTYRLKQSTIFPCTWEGVFPCEGYLDSEITVWYGTYTIRTRITHFKILLGLGNDYDNNVFGSVMVYFCSSKGRELFSGNLFQGVINWNDVPVAEICGGGIAINENHICGCYPMTPGKSGTVTILPGNPAPGVFYKLTPCTTGGVIITDDDLSLCVGKVVLLDDNNRYEVSETAVVGCEKVTILYVLPTCESAGPNVLFVKCGDPSVSFITTYSMSVYLCPGKVADVDGVCYELSWTLEETNHDPVTVINIYATCADCQCPTGEHIQCVSCSDPEDAFVIPFDQSVKDALVDGMHVGLISGTGGGCYIISLTCDEEDHASVTWEGFWENCYQCETYIGHIELTSCGVNVDGERVSIVIEGTTTLNDHIGVIGVFIGLEYELGVTGGGDCFSIQRSGRPTNHIPVAPGETYFDSCCDCSSDIEECEPCGEAQTQPGYMIALTGVVSCGCVNEEQQSWRTTFTLGGPYYVPQISACSYYKEFNGNFSQFFCYVSNGDCSGAPSILNYTKLQITYTVGSGGVSGLVRIGLEIPNPYPPPDTIWTWQTIFEGTLVSSSPCGALRIPITDSITLCEDWDYSWTNENAAMHVQGVC